MTRTARGTLEKPGSCVQVKARLNRGFRDAGWGYLRSQLRYKAHRVVRVPPQHTSQACSRCGHVDRDNRKTQSEFACVSCGYVRNADVNAAVNIWRRELAQLDGEKRSC